MNYYFVGIGGIGMSALARFFHGRGDTVSGYDRTPSALTAQLEAEGIAVHYADEPQQLPQAIDLAVYTPAVPQELGEMQELRRRGVRMLKRSQVLGELTRGKRCVAVAGSHGKTTTTTLIAHLLREGGCGCSAFLGGMSKNYGTNMLVDPQSEYVVVEADEYDRSFLQLHPYISVVTATDPDHLDIYGTHECMMDAYLQFANQTEADGRLFLKPGLFRKADGSVYAGYDRLTAQHATYCVAGSADYHAERVRAEEGDICFDLHTPEGVLADLRLRGTALFNVENAVAAAVVAMACGVDEERLRRGLLSFAGVKRRFDYRINTPQMVYIDDYAHHPREIAATIESVRFLYPGKRVVGVFQPHLYSRTRDLADAFAEVLGRLDALVLMPIYPAREKPIEGVNSEMLLERVELSEKCLCQPQQVAEQVAALHADVVLSLGAGDIDRIVQTLEETLKRECR